mgnify:CR=1 FL=1
MATIIYCSNAGSAKRYAELLSEKTGMPCVDIKNMSTASADEEIIFISWIMAGAIQGINEVREVFGSIKAICGVGMMKSEKATEDTKAKNAVTEPYFFLTGDFDINKLTGMYKMMMGMMLRMMKSKLKEEENGAEMLSLLENGIKGFDEKELDAVIEFLA